MSEAVVFSIIESPLHPDFSELYRQMGMKQVVLTSMRKAIAELKKQAPDFVVAEFFYGYGNNYAGVNVCNLDVFMYSLQKYAPQAKMIVLVEKHEYQYVEKLEALFELHAVFTLPVNKTQMQQALEAKQD